MMKQYGLNEMKTTQRSTKSKKKKFPQCPSRNQPVYEWPKERGNKSSSAGEQTTRSLFGLVACLLQNCVHQISLCVHFWCLTISFDSETREKNLQTTVPRGKQLLVTKFLKTLLKYMCYYGFQMGFKTFHTLHNIHLQVPLSGLRLRLMFPMC